MKTLKMIFTLDNDSDLTISLKYPKAGLTQAEVDSVMQDIIAKKALVADGNYAKAAKESYIYTTEKEELA